LENLTIKFSNELLSLQNELNEAIKINQILGNKNNINNKNTEQKIFSFNNIDRNKTLNYNTEYKPEYYNLLTDSNYNKLQYKLEKKKYKNRKYIKI